MSTENDIIIDPNRLFVPSKLNSPPNSARSGLEPFEKMKFGLAWLNLTYAPQSFLSNSTKVILRNVSGQIKFGQIMGIMGPSGCGKSTLLSCINGRIDSGLSPETRMYASTSHSIHSCFIVQDQKEHLLMNLTTRESLLYASKIKNNMIDSTDKIHSFDFTAEKSDVGIVSSTLNLLGIKKGIHFDHNSNVNKLMADLTLNDCADTLVSNCSGGQQKRIVIALELAAHNKPNIMCIDEPTSGLDSNSAEQVIDCLRNICRDHSIGIIATIHQPNSDILYMFDTLYVLAKGGHCIFNSRPQNIRAFLLDSNIAIKETQVPIEVLMKLASKATFSKDNSEEFQVHEDIKTLADKISTNDEELRQKCQAFGKLTDPESITIKSIDFYFVDLWVLLQRNFKCSIIRGWRVIFFLTFFEICTGLFNAYLFGKSGIDGGCVNFDPAQPLNITCIPVESLIVSKEDPSSVKNFKQLFFLILTHNFLQLCYNIVTYPTEVKLFFNEQQNRWYSTGAYFWAKNLIDGFVGIFITFTFLTPIYFITGQMGNIYDKYYGWYLFSNIMSLFCIQGMCSTFSIIAVRNFRMCLILGIGGLLINTMLSGFLMPINSMNEVIKFISYISFLRLTFETQLYNLYGFNRCDPKQGQWSLVLYRFDFDEEGFYFNIYLLIAYTIMWRIVALICLIVKTNKWNPITNIINKRKKNKQIMFDKQVFNINA